jgi:nucleoside-triphosphatase THEP1
MKNREDFLDEAVEKIINRDDLIYIDENGLVKYKYTQSEIKEMVDNECDDLFEEYKADESHN